MKIKVNKPENDFTMVPNHVLKDGRLSSEAVGLLCWLMMNADGFTVTLSDIEERFGFKKTRWRRIRDELKAVGALEQEFTPRQGTSLSVGWPSPQTDTTIGVLPAGFHTGKEKDPEGYKNGPLGVGKPDPVKRKREKKGAKEFMTPDEFTQYKLNAKPGESRSQYRARIEAG